VRKTKKRVKTKKKRMKMVYVPAGDTDDEDVNNVLGINPLNPNL